MLELLQYFGLPVGISSVSGRIDEIIVIVHYLMLVLFIGWGIFFIVSLVKFRASKNKKANYKGVESHYSSVMEAAVAVIEIVILFGFAFPIWAERVNDVPDPRDAEHIRVIAQQYAWNIHYPGADGKFGETRIDLVDEQDNPIGLDRGSEFGKDDFYTINPSEIPTDIQVMINNDEKGAALLRIVEVIGPDELDRIDEDTIYFIISTLNQLNIDLIRNKILLKVLPLKV